MVHVLLCRVGVEPTVEVVPNDDKQFLWDLLGDPQEADVDVVTCTLGTHEVFVLRDVGNVFPCGSSLTGPADYDYLLVAVPGDDGSTGDLDEDDAMLREIVARGVHPYASEFGNLMHRLAREREVAGG